MFTKKTNFHKFSAFLVAVMMVTVFLGISPSTSAQAAKDTNLLPEKILNSDGTLNLSTGYSGSLDVGNYAVTLDHVRGPILTPLAAPGVWSTMGPGLDSQVYAIAISGTGDVYVGGNIGWAGNLRTQMIAKWNGTSWSALDEGLIGTVEAIAVSDAGDVYAGGIFTNAGGDPNADYIAKWNGTSWSALGTTPLNNYVRSIATSGTDVYVGGNFTDAGGDANADYIAKWNGTTWSALGSTPLAGPTNVYSIAVGDTGDVYAGGAFTNAGGDPNADKIAKFSNGAWSALGTTPPINWSVWAVAIGPTGEVYVGGNFLDAGGDPNADYIAKWNGSVWSAVGVLNNNVYAIAISGTDVYAGGDFLNAGGDPNADYIAKWNGSTWSAPATTPLNNSVRAIAANAWYLYVGGEFKDVNGDPNADNITMLVLSTPSDTTAPTVDTFTVASTSSSLNIPITAFTATDAVGVTGYKITESNTVPGSGTSGWSSTVPTTYTVGRDGTYTLYPWAKDAAGNVSSVYGAPRTVTVNTTAKAITAFGFTSPAATGTITEATHTIAVSVPFGTDVTALAATFVTTGASVKVGATTQTSGITTNDFTNPVTYTVTAADASTQSYTVTVTIAPNPSAPIVTSIVRAGAAPITTNLFSVDFTVTFSESVTGVDAADFKLTNTLLTGAAVTEVSGSGAVYTVAVNTGTGNGTIRLDVPTTATIQDLDGNSFVGPYTSGEAYTVDKGTAPTVPVLVSPANGVLVSGYKPTLDWNDSAPIMALANDWSYEINVTDNLGTYDQTFNTASGLSNSSYTFTTALPVSTTFSWKVRAYNDNNQFSAWSATRTFSTGSKLDTPVLSLPSDGTTENNKRPTFSWVAMPDAATYTLQILQAGKVAVTGTIKAPAHTFTPTADLLPGTLYTWKVKANNGVNSGDFSDPFTFTTSINPPKMPVLTLPANSALVDSAAVQTLKWSPVLAVTTTSPATTYPAAASFQVEYATNSTFSDAIAMVVNSNVDPQLSLPIGTLLPNRTYYWRVRSWSAAGAAGNHSAWSAARTLRTRLAIPVPNLPANSALLDNKRPTFGWDEVTGATSYTLQILKENPKTHLFTVVAHTGTIKVPSYVYTPTVDLLPGTVYTWMVKANGTNAGIYSAPLTFTTSINPPKMPVLSAPANATLVDSTAPQTLKWSPVLAIITSSPTTTYPAAVSYQVEYATNAAFTNNTTVTVTAAETSPISLLPGRTYYWRVRSWSAAGASGNHSAWSLVRTIKVKFVAPSLTSPAAGATGVGIRPTFTWNSTNGLWTNYTLQVATTTAFGTGTRSFTVTAPFTSFTIPDSLPALTPGTTYYWRVKINGLYTPITSAMWQFSVAP